MTFLVFSVFPAPDSPLNTCKHTEKLSDPHIVNDQIIKCTRAGSRDSRAEDRLVLAVCGRRQTPALNTFTTHFTSDDALFHLFSLNDFIRVSYFKSRVYFIYILSD